MQMQNVKGTADFFGPEQSLRLKVRKVLEEVFELYDFTPMETPVLNELELLASKYTGGEEILKEMYRLTDQGERELGLRYDLTLPFAKVMALNPGLSVPFKRYEIGKVFRDGPVKRGRMREFLQCDADVAGIDGPEAEAELMQLAAEVFRRLEVPVTIRWNNRRLLGEVLESVGVKAEDTLTVMLTLDKKDKLGTGAVMRELAEKGLEPAVLRPLTALLEMERPTFDAVASACGILESPGAGEVLALQRWIGALGMEETCRFDPFLSRGLSFYTGTVYEIFDASGAYTSSLGAGGRYDDMIGRLVGREDLARSAAGLSFGMESMMELLRARESAQVQAIVDIISVGGMRPEALAAAKAFRENGIRTRLSPGGRKLAKALAASSALGIPYIVLVGEEEAALGQVRLKDMGARTESVLDLDEAVHVLSKLV